MKDNFSARSNAYAKFRPVYPDAVYRFLLPFVADKDVAWDCGTGNGQVARELAKHFQVVHATDISAKQIENAVAATNIYYKVEAAEQTSFPNHSFDLITIAQAIHWFDFDKFYSEVKRVLKPDGIIAVIGYGLPSINNDVDKTIDHFYNNITGSYWDKERNYIDENYLTIPFPFDEIATPQFFIETEWNINELIGFLGTWSAVQHYIRANNQNPIELITEELNRVWIDGKTLTVKFPVLLRVGKLIKN